jgi:hypothetical protein
MLLSISEMTNFFSTLSTSLAKVGQFWQEKLNGTVFRWNLVVIIAQTSYIWYRYNSLPPEVPLYYSRPWGVEQLAASATVFLLPLMSFIVMIINTLFAVFLLRSNSLLSRLLVITSLLFSILTLTAVFRSINLVI